MNYHYDFTSIQITHTTTIMMNQDSLSMTPPSSPLMQTGPWGHLEDGNDDVADDPMVLAAGRFEQ